MKKVLLISVTNYNLDKDLHLKRKFEGLGGGIKTYVLGRGKNFRGSIWNAKFYLLPPGIFYWPFAFFLSLWICYREKIDTIESQSPLLEGFLGTILKKIFKSELIIDLHGDWEEGPFLSKKRKFELLERKFIPFLAGTSLKNADKIRAVAKYLEEKARKTAPDKKYFIFPTFTDLNDFLGEKNAEFHDFVLFVGGLSPVKGVDVLVRAFSDVSPKFGNFKFILVGEGPEKNNLKSQIADLNLENKTEFMGKLSLSATKDVMKNCSVLVLPSLSEGLPRVLLEALALGKPVIGSRVGGIPEIIEDGVNGFLFQPGNHGELAEKLVKLLGNRDLMVKMGSSGRNLVRNKFSNENYIKKYLEMINS